jgi:hypothetical protein
MLDPVQHNTTTLQCNRNTTQHKARKESTQAAASATHATHARAAHWLSYDTSDMTHVIWQMSADWRAQDTESTAICNPPKVGQSAVQGSLLSNMSLHSSLEVPSTARTQTLDHSPPPTQQALTACV